MSYNKLEPFDGKRTKWQGLWYQKEWHCFSSSAFNLADLRKFKGAFRIKVIKNRYYNAGENGRPNYLFTIMDASGKNVLDLEVEDNEQNSGTWKYVHWIEGLTEIYTYECSECGCQLVGSYCDNPPNYCPDCGMKMEV